MLFRSNYHARHLWWENDLDKTIHTRIMGTLSFPKTRTKLRVAVDEIMVVLGAWEVLG